MGCGGSKTTEQKPPPKTKKDSPSTPKKIYEPFTEFPTPALLAGAQVEYSQCSPPEDDQDGGHPAPLPPPRTKAEEFAGSRFEAIDRHVHETPPSLASASLQQLVSHLTGPARNDADKVRAIFAWIASQNLLMYDISEVPDKNSALFYLMCAKGNIGSYNTLLSEMCKCANIPCHTVKGRAKGASYRLGEDIVYGNTWCVVQADGTWRLVDQNFGSCFVTGYEDDQWDLVSTDTGNKTARTNRQTHYKMDEFYFFTDPEMFIYNHFTDEQDARMQLLARPVTYQEYKEMAQLTQAFFSLGFRDISHPKCRIDTSDGTVLINVKLPEDKKIMFYFDLYKSRGTKALAEFNGINLKDFVVVDTEDDTKRVNVTLKYIGKYKLDLFACDKGASLSSTYRICEYLIHCERPKFNCKPNPANPRDEFGPGAEAILLGLTPLSHRLGTIQTTEGVVEIRFRCTRTDLEFYQVLESRGKKSAQLQDYSRHYVNDSEVVFHVKTPQHGTYLLKLHSRQQGTNSSYTNICSYLVESEVGCTNLTPFPKAPERAGRVGQSTTTDMGLVPISHPEAIFQAQDQGSVTIEMQCERSLDFNLQFDLHTNTGDVDCKDFVWHELVDDRVRFYLRFPHAGLYDFAIFAKTAGKSGFFKDAWRYIITVDEPMKECVPFPSSQPAWQNTFSLKTPLEAYLKQKESVEFQLEVPGAKEVALLSSSGHSMEICQSLDSLGGGHFKGVVDTAYAQDLILSAMLGSEMEYTNLLEYKVLTAEEQAEVQAQQSQTKTESRMRLKQLENRRTAEAKAAEDRKKTNSEIVQKEEEEFEKNKDKLWEEEDRLEKLALEENRRALEEEERKLKESETALTQSDTDAVLKEQMQQIEDAKNTETMRLRRLQKAQKARMAREQMRDSTKRRDIDTLGICIKNFTALGLEEENGDLTKAEHVLGVLEAKKALMTAMDERSIDDIVESIEHIKLKGYQVELQAEVQMAEKMLRSLRKLQDLKLRVLQMEGKTMSEIRSYSRPPIIVHQVMAASLLLLGVDEDVTGDWRECRKLVQPLGPTGLNRRLHQFNIEELHPEITARTSVILGNLEFKQVLKVSAGAATFYVWAMGTVEEAGNLRQSEGEAKPAGIARQKEILGVNSTTAQEEESPRHQRRRRGNHGSHPT